MNRFLALALLAVTLTGCQAASASPPAPPPDDVHPFSKTERIEVVLERSATAAEASDAKLAELSAKVDQTNDLLGQLLEQSKLAAGQQCDILDSLKKEGTVIVPPEPPKAVARSAGETTNPPLVSENEVLDPNVEGRITTNDGKRWDLNQFIRTYYKYPVFVEGMTVDEHLNRDHGVIYDPSLSLAEKNKLHAASHEYEKHRPAKQSPASTLMASDCPNGQCPLQSRSVTVTTPNSTRSRSSAVYSTAQSQVQSYQSSRPVYYSTRRTFSSSRCNGRRCRF